MAFINKASMHKRQIIGKRIPVSQDRQQTTATTVSEDVLNNESWLLMRSSLKGEEECARGKTRTLKSVNATEIWPSY